MLLSVMLLFPLAPEILPLRLDLCRRRRQEEGVERRRHIFREFVELEPSEGEDEDGLVRNCLKKRGRIGMLPTIIPRAISAKLCHC